MRLAFVGHAAVGKDTLALYVSKRLSIPNVSSGDMIRKYVTDNNLGTLERENLKKVGNSLRQEFGGDFLVRLAVELHDKGDIVLSGLRTIDEVMTFKELGGIVISVTAPAERRYDLAKMRNRIDDGVSFEEWKKNEEGEYTSDDSKKQNINGVIALADYEIQNLGTLDDLYKECDELLKSLLF